MKKKLERRLERELSDAIYELFDIRANDYDFGKVWYTAKNNMYVECWVGDCDNTAHILAKFDQQRRLKEIKDLEEKIGRWIK